MATRSPGRSPRKPAKAAIPVATPVADGPPLPQDASDRAVPGEDVTLPDVKLHGETRPLEDREARIARAAYRRAEERGFYPGQEIDDWLAAEKEVAESETNLNR